jgi:hypothetical protein
MKKGEKGGEMGSGLEKNISTEKRSLSLFSIKVFKKNESKGFLSNFGLNSGIIREYPVLVK